jgi:hypothetical protein
VKFFLDNCVSPHLARGLRGLAGHDDHEIVHLREKFEEATVDRAWISQLASEGGWIIVSGDTRITRNPIERAAWYESNLTAFFFSEPWNTDGYWKKCHAVVGWWPLIIAQAKRTPRGHGFVLPKKGTQLKRIYP